VDGLVNQGREVAFACGGICGVREGWFGLGRDGGEGEVM